ncbi:hypothetical protein GCM10010439_73280 [Actinocorallia aurantiaca]|uniref:Uncharacterized protein n=1 Tax=Actinocorallia aurantiaca TaxID=46204 RepID=A0ABN3UUD5_9ACTN
MLGQVANVLVLDTAEGLRLLARGLDDVRPQAPRAELGSEMYKEFEPVGFARFLRFGMAQTLETPGQTG